MLDGVQVHLRCTSDAGCALALGATAGVRSTSVQDVMRRLLQRKNIMVRPPGPAAAVREAKYIAAIDILQVLVVGFGSEALVAAALMAAQALHMTTSMFAAIAASHSAVNVPPPHCCIFLLRSTGNCCMFLFLDRMGKCLHSEVSAGFQLAPVQHTPCEYTIDVLVLLQGEVDLAEVHRTHSRMRSRGDLPFQDRWPASLQVGPRPTPSPRQQSSCRACLSPGS